MSYTVRQIAKMFNITTSECYVMLIRRNIVKAQPKPRQNMDSRISKSDMPIVEAHFKEVNHIEKNFVSNKELKEKYGLTTYIALKATHATKGKVRYNKQFRIPKDRINDWKLQAGLRQDEVTKVTDLSERLGYTVGRVREACKGLSIDIGKMDYVFNKDIDKITSKLKPENSNEALRVGARKVANRVSESIGEEDLYRALRASFIHMRLKTVYVREGDIVVRAYLDKEGVSYTIERKVRVSGFTGEFTGYKLHKKDIINLMNMREGMYKIYK